jgi:5-methylcytosine-specific restriction endonuclease McrA
MVKMAMSKKAMVMENLMARDGDKCLHCGERVRFSDPESDPLAATIEHIIPVARGGSNYMFNLALAHYRCNARRGTKRITQEELVLRFSSRIKASRGPVCYWCGHEAGSMGAMLLHRFAAHGVLTTAWIERGECDAPDV